MTTVRFAAAAAIVLLSACAGSGREEQSADTTVAAAVAAGPSAEVTRAAEISNAITNNPTKTDSILAAHSVTPEQLTEMMFRIARDSTASADYGKLTAR